MLVKAYPIKLVIFFGMILLLIIEKSFLLPLFICVSKAAARVISAPNRAFRDIRLQATLVPHGHTARLQGGRVNTCRYAEHMVTKNSKECESMRRLLAVHGSSNTPVDADTLYHAISECSARVRVTDLFLWLGSVGG